VQAFLHRLEDWGSAKCPLFPLSVISDWGSAKCPLFPRSVISNIGIQEETVVSLDDSFVIQIDDGFTDPSYTTIKTVFHIG
jgi:hypothetical protein